MAICKSGNGRGGRHSGGGLALAPRLGRQPSIALESAVETRQIFETAFKSNGEDAARSLAEKLTGVVDAQAGPIVQPGASGRSTEQVREAPPAHPQLGRGMVQIAR